MELWPPRQQGRANRVPFVDAPASLNAPRHVAPKRCANPFWVGHHPRGFVPQRGFAVVVWLAPTSAGPERYGDIGRSRHQLCTSSALYCQSRAEQFPTTGREASVTAGRRSSHRIGVGHLCVAHRRWLTLVSNPLGVPCVPSADWPRS
jgi:hypothetical protein